MNANSDLLDKDDSLLLVVDLQPSVLTPCVEADRIKKNTSILIDVAQVLNIPVIFTEQNPQKLGKFLPEILEKVSNPNVFAKMEFGCFENDVIYHAITASKRKSLLLTGIEAHVCIFQTGARGIQLGYNVHVVTDAVSSSSQMSREMGLRRLERAGCVISSMEMAIFELLRQANTPEFRKSLAHIKMILR